MDPVRSAVLVSKQPTNNISAPRRLNAHHVGFEAAAPPRLEQATCRMSTGPSHNKFFQEVKPVKRSILGVLLVLTLVAAVAAAPTLTFTYTDVHANKTALETDAYAVNNAGAIAGDYIDSKNVQHGMIIHSGKQLTTVDNTECEAALGTGGISFYGLNSKVEAAGWCISAKTGLDIAFVYSKGKFTPVDFPKSNGTQATGINDKGEVVGLYLDSANATHGFSKIGTKYTDISVKGETNTVAWGVNNAGQITVYATNSAGDFDAYLLTGKTFKNIDNPKAKGGLGTIVHTPAPNTKDIDGTYYNSAGAEMGWLLHNGKYYDVADPGDPTDTRADGLNDKAELVGRYGAGTGGGGTGFQANFK